MMSFVFLVRMPVRGFLPLSLVTLLLLLGCKDESVASRGKEFSLAAVHDRAAFMAIHGTGAEDVWAVGADDGQGPVVLHYGKEGWLRHDAGVRGDFWWVQAVAKDNVYFAGSDAHVVHFDGTEFRRLNTPGLGKHIIFGLWAAGEDDLYAVGAVGSRHGFIWHYDGEAFSEVPVPLDVTLSTSSDAPPFFKVVGTSSEDVWVVGGEGTVLRGNATDGFEPVASGTEEPLFTAHTGGGEVILVGGSRDGVVLAADAGVSSGKLENVTPEGAPLLQGAWVSASGDTWLSGRDGELYLGDRSGFSPSPLELHLNIQSLHAIWVDPDGDVWSVGGNVLSGTLDAGAVVTTKARVGLWAAEPINPEVANACPDDAEDPTPDGSVARKWNEQILNAIRRDLPRPTVHARNLLHVSIAMWDAWAAFDESAQGVVVDEDASGEDVEAARREAISYAAYRVLTHRYQLAIGGAVSQSCFERQMEILGFSPGNEETEGDSPSALGNRIGQSVIDAFADDGANEAHDYTDPEGYSSEQPLLIVEEPGTLVEQPSQWQQILLAESVTQNGIPEGSGVREYVGAHWGQVTPWALERPGEGEPYYRGENPPTSLDDGLVEAAVQVLRKSLELDVDDGEVMDISPRSYGNNSLGADDGKGRAENPFTGAPYEEEVVLRGDFTRILAEFWADGPTSETPPGHWNTLANLVADHPNASHKLFGEGEPFGPLKWDVHVYLALNGAVHDAAIAAWELKRFYTSARPITLIRYMASKGQRTDPDGPSFDPEGIPLETGLIEVITEESSSPGERHEHLSRYVGEVAVRSWQGEPGDRERDIGGVGWIRGAEWIPYQRRTFVTPAFPGYVSGHSTFSRAAAVVLAELTGTEYFPGGLATYALQPGYLVFEHGPTEAVTLRWATYFDASDQAGQSRLWGGIHVVHDDYDGRRIGADVGARAVDRARMYFGGTTPE